MPDNPWFVDNVKKFLFLNCPECEFKTKKKNRFHDHAVEIHPSSVLLFNKINENDPLELESGAKYKKLDTENLELEDLQNEETLEEIMFPEIKVNVLKREKMLSDKSVSDKNDTKEREMYHLCNFCKHSCKNIADLKIHVKRHQNVLPMAMIGRVISGLEF